jgi:hypothetical protein
VIKSTEKSNKKCDSLEIGLTWWQRFVDGCFRGRRKENVTKKS